MGRYRPFSQILLESLRYAAHAAHVVLTAEVEAWLIDAYNNLSPYPDAAYLLTKLKKQGIQTVALSNGSMDMLAPLLHNSGLEGGFDLILSVDECKQYKPSPASYSLVLDHTQLTRSQIMFVAAHGWDTSGATSFGFHSTLVNRKDQPLEQLHLPPDYICYNLASVLQTL
jgi:2-haloacid dehalogenase